MTPQNSNKFSVSRVATWLILILMAFVLYILFTLLASGQLDTTNRPVPTPRLTDLGKDQITHRAFPSLAYGIHAFIWWDSYKHSLDLERVRQMRFQYVTQ